jgi:hypothetical protein
MERRAAIFSCLLAGPVAQERCLTNVVSFGIQISPINFMRR